MEKFYEKIIKLAFKNKIPLIDLTKSFNYNDDSLY
jgi:hypothetical protein